MAVWREGEGYNEGMRGLNMLANSMAQRRSEKLQQKQLEYQQERDAKNDARLDERLNLDRRQDERAQKAFDMGIEEKTKGEQGINTLAEGILKNPTAYNIDPANAGAASQLVKGLSGTQYGQFVDKVMTTMAPQQAKTTQDMFMKGLNLKVQGDAEGNQDKIAQGTKIMTSTIDAVSDYAKAQQAGQYDTNPAARHLLTKSIDSAVDAQGEDPDKGTVKVPTQWFMPALTEASQQKDPLKRQKIIEDSITKLNKGQWNDSQYDQLKDQMTGLVNQASSDDGWFSSPDINKVMQDSGIGDNFFVSAQTSPKERAIKRAQAYGAMAEQSGIVGDKQEQASAPQEDPILGKLKATLSLEDVYQYAKVKGLTGLKSDDILVRMSQDPEITGTK